MIKRKRSNFKLNLITMKNWNYTNDFGNDLNHYPVNKSRLDDFQNVNNDDLDAARGCFAAAIATFIIIGLMAFFYAYLTK
jgi:hypothetical protein